MNASLNTLWTLLSTTLVCFSLISVNGCDTSPTSSTSATTSTIPSTVNTEQCNDSAAINRDDREPWDTWFGPWRCTNLEEMGLSEFLFIFDGDRTYQSFARLDDITMREIGTWRFLRPHRLELHVTMLDGQPVSEFYELTLRRIVRDSISLTYDSEFEPVVAEFVRDYEGASQGIGGLAFGTEVE